MSKEVDENTFWTWKDKTLSYEGVFPYKGSSIRIQGMKLDPEKFYNVYRPREELEKAAESFEALPFFEKHVMVGDKPQWKKVDEKGGGGTLYRVKMLGDKLVASIKVWSEKLKQKIEEIKGLSLGYSCDYIPEKGVFKGKPYDFRQVNLSGNHLALVPFGRMGASVALDELPIELGLSRSFAMDSVDFDEAELKIEKGDDMAKGKGKDESEKDKSTAQDEFVSVEKLYEKFPEQKEWIDANKYQRKEGKDADDDGSESEDEDKDEDKGKGASDPDVDKSKEKDKGDGKDGDDDGKADKEKGSGMDQAEIAENVRKGIKQAKSLLVSAKKAGISVAMDEFEAPEKIATEICKSAKIPTDNAIVRAESFLAACSAAPAKIPAKKSATYAFDADDGNKDTTDEFMAQFK